MRKRTKPIELFYNAPAEYKDFKIITIHAMIYYTNTKLEPIRTDYATHSISNCSSSKLKLFLHPSPHPHLRERLEPQER